MNVQNNEVPFSSCQQRTILSNQTVSYLDITVMENMLKDLMKPHLQPQDLPYITFAYHSFVSKMGVERVFVTPCLRGVPYDVPRMEGVSVKGTITADNRILLSAMSFNMIRDKDSNMGMKNFASWKLRE